MAEAAAPQAEQHCRRSEYDPLFNRRSRLQGFDVSSRAALLDAPQINRRSIPILKPGLTFEKPRYKKRITTDNWVWQENAGNCSEVFVPPQTSIRQLYF
jgi:hypothetical protein